MYTRIKPGLRRCSHLFTSDIKFLLCCGLKIVCPASEHKTGRKPNSTCTKSKTFVWWLWFWVKSHLNWWLWFWAKTYKQTHKKCCIKVLKFRTGLSTMNLSKNKRRPLNMCFNNRVSAEDKHCSFGVQHHSVSLIIVSLVH